MILGLWWCWLQDVTMFGWCILCVDVPLLSWVVTFYCLLSVIFEIYLSILLRSVFDLAFLHALTSRSIDHFHYSMMDSFLQSRKFFVFYFIVFRVSLIISLIYRDYRNFCSKSFVSRRRTKIFVTLRRSGWTSFDEMPESKNFVTSGLEVEKSFRYDIWFFDISLTFMKTIKIMITKKPITISTNG